MISEAELKAFRDHIRDTAVPGRYAHPVPPGRGACVFVAVAIHQQYGWEAVTGDFDNDDRIWMHTWNRRPDGWLVDATADQFGYEDVLICAPDDPRAARYEQIAIIE